MKKTGSFRKHPHARKVRVGHREVLSYGLVNHFWTDLYYLSMTVSWPVFFAAGAALFILLNLVFGTAYLLGDNAIAHARPGNFLDYFFFSIETLATVGYGDMHPQTVYGHTVTTIEIFTGLSSVAVATGLIFARFSRPRARLVYAKNLVISEHEGQRALMLRIANARHANITDARAKLWLIKSERTKEGVPFRSFVRLPLLREENPVFILTWTMFHIIDKASPLFDKTPADLEDWDASIVLTLSGLNERAAQEVHGRRIYSFADIRWEHRYADIVEEDNEGHTRIDYARFHDVVPLKPLKAG